MPKIIVSKEGKSETYSANKTGWTPVYFILHATLGEACQRNIWNLQPPASLRAYTGRHATSSATSSGWLGRVLKANGNRDDTPNCNVLSIRSRHIGILCLLLFSSLFITPASPFDSHNYSYLVKCCILSSLFFILSSVFHP